MEVRVRVRAGARREKLEKLSEHSFAISIREEARGNAANQRVIELVALQFKVPVVAVRIVRGHRSSSKVLAIP